MLNVAAVMRHSSCTVLCFTIQKQLAAKEEDLAGLRTDAELLEKDRNEWKLKYEEHKVYVIRLLMSCELHNEGSSIPSENFRVIPESNGRFHRSMERIDSSKRKCCLVMKKLCTLKRQLTCEKCCKLQILLLVGAN